MKALRMRLYRDWTRAKHTIVLPGKLFVRWFFFQTIEHESYTFTPPNS